MSNILIIKHGSLGDIAQASGAIQDIFENYKNDQIYLLTTKPYFELFKKNPFIHDVILDKRLSKFNLIYLYSLMKEIKYDFAYHFFYSERPKTLAERKYEDDIPMDVKKRRLKEVTEIQRSHSLEHHQKYIGTVQKILIEGPSRKSIEQQCGRNTQNAMVVFDKSEYAAGQYIDVLIEDCTAATLFGRVMN